MFLSVEFILTSEYGNNKARLSPEYVFLGFLFSQSGYGYELHKRLGDEFGFIWHVSQSQTYNILNRLETHGYVSSELIEQENLPPRHLLHITPSGEKRFKHWLDIPTSCSVHAIRMEFLTRLYFMQMYHPELLEQTIQHQANEVTRGLDRLNVQRLTLPGDQSFNHLALELRIQLLNSIINWLGECLIKLPAT
jgi:DNA-binding PadR family transcriptional regulator